MTRPPLRLLSPPPLGPDPALVPLTLLAETIRRIVSDQRARVREVPFVAAEFERGAAERKMLLDIADMVDRHAGAREIPSFTVTDR